MNSYNKMIFLSWMLLLILPAGVRMEGATYAVGFMNITTDKQEVGFIQILIVASNLTFARVQAVTGAGYDNFTQISSKADTFYNATLNYDQLRVVTATTINEQEVMPLGLLVSSSSDCNVFGIKSDRGTTDGFLALPLTTTSNQFFISSWPCDRAIFFSGFQVAAAANDTCVEIYRIENGTYKFIKSFYMTQFDILTYTAGVRNTSDPNDQPYKYDLSGYYVNSSKPIAVYAGHSCAFVPLGVSYCDHMVEQIPPLDELGYTHIVPPIRGRLPEAGYFVRVVATNASTAISYTDPAGDVQGSVILAAGQYLDIHSKSAALPMKITCSIVCLVMQYNAGYQTTQSSAETPTDPYMSLVTPVERFDDSAGFATANFCDNRNKLTVFNNYAVIIIRENYKDDVLLDGQPVPLISWSSYWSYAVAVMPVTHDYHIVTLRPRSAGLFGLYVYGHSVLSTSTSAYGFAAAFKVAGTLVTQNWEASKEVFEQMQTQSMAASCEQEQVYSGSVVTAYRPASVAPLVNYSILLDVSPVKLSISTMTERCRDLYEAEIVTQLKNLSRTINYEICKQVRCPYVTGSPGSGAPVGSTPSTAISTNNVMFVVIDVRQLDSSVQFDFDSSTGVITAIHVTVPYVGLLDTTSVSYAQCRAEIRDLLKPFANWPLTERLVSNMAAAGCGSMTFSQTKFSVGQKICQPV